MKTICKILIIPALILWISNVTSAQNDKASKADIREQKQYEKELKREQRQQESERMAEITKLMVKQQRFVLEADYLSNKYGYKVPVSPNINFIMIDSLDATIQIGSAFSIGYNGVGGETMEGRIIKYEFVMIGKKKDTYSISTNIMSSLGTYDITLMVNREGYADATIRGNWSGQLNYHGKLVPLGISKVYKGHTRY